MSRIFRTTQNNIVIPTKNLIKIKNTDFRVLLLLSVISNVDNNILSGSNTRYCSLRKVGNNMDKMSKTISITPDHFKRQINTLLKCGSDEFKLVEVERNNKKQYEYQIQYEKGGFVTIPYETVEKILLGLSNTCIKVYVNLLWLCIKDGDFSERQITQKYLAELMGLSSVRAVKIATETLEKQGLIKIKKEWQVDTKVIDGKMITNPKETIVYSIVLEEM